MTATADMDDDIDNALAQRFKLGDLTVSERARVRDIIRDRIQGGLSRSDGNRTIARHMLKPAFFDQEALIALQIVLQEKTLRQSRELLSTVKAGYRRLIADIDAFFVTLEETEKQLTIAPVAGKHRPQPYRPPNTETETTRNIRLSQLISERGWKIPVNKVRGIESGIIRVLSERYPNSLETDFNSIVEVIRARAVAYLEDNDGNWPRRKGNWYADEIDQFQSEQPDLFAPLLLRN